MLSAILSLTMLLPLFLLPAATLAATVAHDFTISWLTSSPDGFARPVIGINSAWPPPPIVASVGDRVVITVRNELEKHSTSLHFHGLFMEGANSMDGPSGVTQCGIPPGSSFTYDFTVSYLMTGLNLC